MELDMEQQYQDEKDGNKEKKGKDKIEDDHEDIARGDEKEEDNESEAHFKSKEGIKRSYF